MNARGEIRVDTIVTFYLHLNNYTDFNIYGLTHGFKVFSMDGADWQSTVPYLVDETLDDIFDFGGVQMVTIDVDGSLSDTVGFGGTCFWEDGVPVDYDTTSFSISIGPIDSAMGGKTIIIDSCTFSATGEWVWVRSNGTFIIPDWDGPYEYTIEDPHFIQCIGKANYRNPRPGAPQIQMPIRNCRMQVWEEEWGLYDDTMLVELYTDDTGGFYSPELENDDGAFQDGLDIYFKFFAENNAAIVYDTLNIHRYQFATPVDENLEDGIHYWPIATPYYTTDSIDTNAGFFIADAMLEAHDQWQELTQLDLPYVKVDASIGSPYKTFYSHLYNYIHIEMAISLFFPDKYDTPILYHEYGHYIEDVYDFFDNGGGDHKWDSIINPGLAASEGFSHFFSSIIRNDPEWRNYTSVFNTYMWYNIENGHFGIPGQVLKYANNYGDSNEAAVAGIFWDIYDDDSDDVSTYGVLGFDSADGRGDTLSLSAEDVIDILRYVCTDGQYPDDINEYWNNWLAHNGDHIKALSDIYCEHGIIKSPCGDANADISLNIGDAVYLISYIFKGGPPVNPPYLGNANGDSDLNIGDPVYLINHMFRGGAAPTSCENLQE